MPGRSFSVSVVRVAEGVAQLVYLFPQSLRVGSVYHLGIYAGPHEVGAYALYLF